MQLHLKHQTTCITLCRCGCKKYETNLDPAGRVFDVVSGVVRTPALDEAESQYAQFAQLVHTDARRHWHACEVTKHYTIVTVHCTCKQYNYMYPVHVHVY